MIAQHQVARQLAATCTASQGAAAAFCADFPDARQIAPGVWQAERPAAHRFPSPENLHAWALRHGLWLSRGIDEHYSPLTGDTVIETFPAGIGTYTFRAGFIKPEPAKTPEDIADEDWRDWRDTIADVRPGA